jgi:hypothetical protein
MNRVGQRLFAIDVLAAFNRSHCRDGVKVIRGGHNYGIDALLHGIEHFAEIPELLGVWELFERAGTVAHIHVT